MRLRQLLERLTCPDPGIDPAELQRLRADAGLPPTEVARSNPDSEQDVRSMAAHFGADLDGAPAAWLGAIRDAERTCACCGTVRRCHNWIADQNGSDSPRLFCPNAEAFDALAAEERKARG